MVDLIALRYVGVFVLAAAADATRGELSYKGMVLRLSSTGFLLRGSLAKLVHGDNIQPMTYQDVLRGLAELETWLGVRLDEATITELELGAVMMIAEPCSNYLVQWGPVPPLRRWDTNFGQTVLYANSHTSFQGYDKTLQCRGKGVPMEYHGAHLLRLELKYKRNRVKAAYGGSLLVKTLRSPEGFADLVERWHRAYQRIPKGGVPRRRFVNSTREFLPWLAAAGLGVAGNQGDVLLAIRQSCDLSAKQKETFRRRLRELAAPGEYLEPTVTTAELDAKVEAVVAGLLGTNRGQA